MANEVPPTPPTPVPKDMSVFYNRLIMMSAMFAFSLLSTVLVMLAAKWLGVDPNTIKPDVVIEQKAVVQAPPPERIVEDTPHPPMGWVYNPKAIKAVTDKLPIKVFSETPAGQSNDPLPKSAFLWEAIRKLTGKPGEPQDQGSVGSCVSFGTNRSAEKSLANQIVESGGFEYRLYAEEVTYSGSRVEIGGGGINGDGSVGAWAAEFGKQYGFLPKGVWGNYDLTKYDTTRCRSWGSSGVPDDLEPQVKQFPVGEITKVTSWDQAKRCLANRYGIAVCSDQGFNRQRDQNGVCIPQGQWMHCMSLDGYFIDANGKEYGHIENSWGNSYHTGPVGWGEPNNAGFWASSTVIDRMLRQGDSWAFSALKGFPKKKLDWFFEPAEKKAGLDLKQNHALFALSF